MGEPRHSVSQRPARFDDFEVHAEDGSLLRDGRRLKIQPQPFRVLEYLVRRAPAIVTREELGEQIWGSGVHVDLDQSVNFCIRQIRQVLGDSATEPRYIETLPKQGYRFIGRVEQSEVGGTERSEDAGGSAAGDVAWEGAEEVGARAGAVGRVGASVGEGGSKSGGLRRWAWIAGGVLVAAVAGVAFRGRLFHGGVAHAAVRSIAVLPLDNFSGEAGQNYLADGVTDELTTMLAKDSTLRVTSRTSVMQYRGAHRPLREIARELGVDGVIEGSVARTGDQVHVNLQLIQAATDAHLWADSYDGKVSDAALLPEEAARAIAKRLDSATPAAAERYVNPAAREAYLRGEYLWPGRTQPQSGPYFLKATEIQPDYAAAWAGLADYYGEGIASTRLDPRTNIARQEEAAKRAIALDPNLAEAHQAMGAMYLIDLWDFDDADREFQRAISLDPQNGEIYYIRACLMQVMRRDGEAIALAKKSMELNPFERPDGLAGIYVGGRHLDEALEDLKLRLAASPNDPELIGLEKEVWRRKGDYKKAVDLWERWHVLTGDPKSAVELRRAYETGGAQGFVRWQLQRRTEQAKTQYVSPGELASLHAQLGEKAETLALLEETYRQHSIDMLWLDADPAFDFLHGEPRYQELMRKVGQPAAK